MCLSLVFFLSKYQLIHQRELWKYPLLSILFKRLWGVYGIWISFVMAELLTMILAIILRKINKEEIKHAFKE